jgi:hypothetical protein
MTTTGGWRSASFWSSKLPTVSRTIQNRVSVTFRARRVDRRIGRPIRPGARAPTGAELRGRPQPPGLRKNSCSMRPAVLWAFRSIPALGRQMRMADQGIKLIPRQLLVEAGQGGPRTSN